MKKIILFFIVFWILLAPPLAAQNPFSTIGKSVEVLSLSQGKYQEYHTNDTLVVIGTALLNTITGEVICSIEPDSVQVRNNAETVTRFWSVDPVGRKYPYYSPYQFAGNQPIRAIDLDGLEEFIVTYFYNNNALTGLNIKLSNPNSDFIIKRTRQTAAIEEVLLDDNLGFMPDSRDKLYEDAFFNLLRNNGILTRIISANTPSKNIRINTPFRIPPTMIPAIPIAGLPIQPLANPIRPIDVPINIRSIETPSSRIVADINLNVVYGSWEDIPLNVSEITSKIDDLITRLKTNPSLNITIEANIGGAEVTSDPKRLEEERRAFGKSSKELVEGRRDKMLKEFRKRARRRGVSKDRINAVIGKRRERSVRVLINKKD